MYDRRYAAILTANKVETTVRLWSVLQADPTFLQTHLEISDEAAELIWSFISVCMYVCMYCMCLAVRRVRRQLTLGEAARVVRRALQVDATGPLTLVHTYIHLYVHEYFYTYNINLACSYTYIHTYSSGRAFPGPVWVGVSAADRASSLCPRDEQGQGEEERGA